MTKIILVSKMKQVIFLACLLPLVITGPVKVQVGYDWSDAAGYEECAEWVVANKTLPKPISDICGVDLECPGHEHVDNPDCGFGIRKVSGGKWVGTKLVDSEGDKKYQTAFHRLFDYISGANADGAKIPMTAPVIMKTFMDSSFKQVGGATYFYIPSAFQANPPAPTNDQVYFEDWDDALVYYRALGDKNDEIPLNVWMSEFTDLISALQEYGHSFYPYESMVAGFTDPWSKEQRMEAMYAAI